MIDKLIPIIFIALLLFCLPSSLHAKQEKVSSPQEPSSATPAAAQSAASIDPNAPGQRYPRYKIGRGDTIDLHFPLSAEFDQTIQVQPDGYVSLRAAGSIHVEGMTVPQLTDAVKAAYSKILHDPIVDVDLTDFQKPFFVVAGQVTKPGQYDLRADITVSEAIGIAGGFAPTAKTQVLLYHRVSTGWMEVKKLNLKDILHGKNVEEDAMMHPGDMIFVPEKFITNFRKYVPYSFGVYANPSAAWF